MVLVQAARPLVLPVLLPLAQLLPPPRLPAARLLLPPQQRPAELRPSSPPSLVSLALSAPLFFFKFARVFQDLYIGLFIAYFPFSVPPLDSFPFRVHLSFPIVNYRCAVAFLLKCVHCITLLQTKCHGFTSLPFPFFSVPSTFLPVYTNLHFAPLWSCD